MFPSIFSFHSISSKFKDFRAQLFLSSATQQIDDQGELSLVQDNATSIIVSENVNRISDKNLGSELTEPSQVCNQIEVISLRLAEQNNTIMILIEKQAHCKILS